MLLLLLLLSLHVALAVLQAAEQLSWGLALHHLDACRQVAAAMGTNQDHLLLPAEKHHLLSWFPAQSRVSLQLAMAMPAQEQVPASLPSVLVCRFSESTALTQTHQVVRSQEASAVVLPSARMGSMRTGSRAACCWMGNWKGANLETAPEAGAGTGTTAGVEAEAGTGTDTSATPGAEAQAGRHKSRSRSGSRRRSRSRSKRRHCTPSRSRDRGHGRSRSTSRALDRSRSGRQQDLSRGSLPTSPKERLSSPACLQSSLDFIEVSNLESSVEFDELCCVVLLIALREATAAAGLTQQAGASSQKAEPSKLAVEIAAEPESLAAAKVPVSQLEQLFSGGTVFQDTSCREFCKSAVKCPILLVDKEHVQVCPVPCKQAMGLHCACLSPACLLLDRILVTYCWAPVVSEQLPILQP